MRTCDNEEVVVRTEELVWKKYFAVLDEVKLDGDCCIEREAGKAAQEFVLK